VAQNACGNSSNENAVTELAAELSLHPISSFAVQWRWRRRLQPGTPNGQRSPADAHDRTGDRLVRRLLDGLFEC